MVSLFFLLLSCITSSASGPCADYCDYICDCHDGEPGFDCDECYAVHGDADAALEDECETALLDLIAADEEAGLVCATASDTTKTGTQ